MAKRTRKSSKFNTTSILLGAIGILAILFVVLFVGNEWSRRSAMVNVKGETTDGKRPPIQYTANAGEACGKSMKLGCIKELICAPLMPPYRLLKKNATPAELAAEEDVVLPEERPCFGRPANEITDRCPQFLPYYGACVKKGVWPPPFQQITTTAIPKPSDSGCIYDGQEYKDGEVFKVDCNTCTCVSGRVRCTTMACTTTPTPTGTLTCKWCGTDCITNDPNVRVKCLAVAPPIGYLCKAVNNVCTKVKATEITRATPTQGQKDNFCGGISGIACPDGYTCQLDGNYPDAGGHCVLSGVKPTPTKRPGWMFWRKQKTGK